MIAVIHSTGGTIVGILLFGAMIIAGIWKGLHQAPETRSRSSELQILAKRLAFDEFNPGRDENFAMGWGFLTRLARGEGRYAFNILRGTYHEYALFMFDYLYQNGSSKEQDDCCGTILMFIVKEAVFPKITISRQGGLLEKIVSLAPGDREVTFESAELSRAFCVRTADKKFAYDVCNPQMMDYLLANRDLDIEIQGPVISIGFDTQLPVEKIEFNLQRLAEIRSLMPQYLFTNA